MRNGNRTIALLLLSLAALNMPQAMVLCVGDDGHVAIEPAGHTHCADGSHVQDYRPKEGEHSHVGCLQGRCCTDIPIPVGSGDNRIVSERSKLTPTLVACLQPAMEIPDAFKSPGIVELSSLWWLSPCSSPLRCVILQV